MKVAVLGAGLMGQGIAAVFAAAGHDVTLWERPERIEESLTAARRRLTALRGSSAAGWIVATLELSAAVGNADVVLESLTEDLVVKQSALADADRMAPPTAIFLTNTSSIPLRDIRLALSERRSLVATHFFNPAEIIAGVEIAVCRPEDEEARDAVSALIESVGKTPATVEATPAFVANRLQIALFREAVLCLEEGIVSAEQLDAIVRSTIGFRLALYGPLRIADMAGLPVFTAILRNLESAYGDRFAVPATVQRLLDDGATGLAAGRGFHDYDPAAREAFELARDAAYLELAAALDRVQQTTGRTA
jgi:3-hydroxybutyryl-CoA dehydrogenase